LEPDPAELGEREYAQDWARVGGRWVVWLDDYAGGGDQYYNEIRVYDLQEGVESGLTESAHPYSEFIADVSDSGLVVWMDWRNGDRSTYYNPDIYGYVLTRFWDVLANHWAYDSIEACVGADIVSGYPEGNYRPAQAVNRGQMAVYVSRALAGGEENVPEPTTDPGFTDVDDTHWAYQYICYAVDQNVVQGYPEGDYKPEQEVTRGQMAVYVARAMVAPSTSVLADYEPADPRNFPDVPTDYWAYNYVEYCVEAGVVGGYLDGTYRPATVVTRDQMAVYIQRAFSLPM